MATIQVADKPTLDAVKEWVDSILTDIGGNVTVTHGVCSNAAALKVTGRGRISFPHYYSKSEVYISELVIDGVSVHEKSVSDKIYVYENFEITFEKSLSIKAGHLSGSAGFCYMMYLME